MHECVVGIRYCVICINTLYVAANGQRREFNNITGNTTIEQYNIM